MKILISTYDTAYQNVAGGVHNRIDQIVKILRNKGLTVDYFNKFQNKISDYDILHIFKYDSTSKQLIDYAKSIGLKIVVSSIVSIEKGRLIDFYWLIRKIPIATLYRQMFFMVNKIDCLIVESPIEKYFMHSHFHFKNSKIEIIPNGANVISHTDDIIFKKLDKTKPYVLVISRFDPNKNQLNIIKAMKKTNIQLVLIGGADPAYIEYYNKCIKEAEKAKNIFFLGWLNSNDELFKSALKYAKVIACPSYNETFGLSIIEGVINGAIPVVSKNLPILGYEIFKDCLQFDPDDCKDILNKIQKALNSDSSITEIAREFFSWDNIAQRHIEIYKYLLEENIERH